MKKVKNICSLKKKLDFYQACFQSFVSGTKRNHFNLYYDTKQTFLRKTEKKNFRRQSFVKLQFHQLRYKFGPNLTKRHSFSFPKICNLKGSNFALFNKTFFLPSLIPTQKVSWGVVLSFLPRLRFFTNEILLIEQCVEQKMASRKSFPLVDRRFPVQKNHAPVHPRTQIWSENICSPLHQLNLIRSQSEMKKKISYPADSK